MKARLLTGISTLLLGLLFIMVPHYLLPVCGNPLACGNMTVPMKCFWSASAEAGLGAVVGLSGLLICFCASAAVRLGISLVNILLALLAIALPGLLIGMCANEAMPCRMGTLPVIYILAALLLLLSIINIVYLRGLSKKGARS